MTGTVEARVFDGEEGVHRFHEEPSEEFEVFWFEGSDLSPAGWYWKTESEFSGPFASSQRARLAADPNWSL